jgi:hypothetical protein
MTRLPSWLEGERVEHVQPAVVASNCKELRRRRPRDRRDTETRGSGIWFKVAQDSAIRAQHNHTAARRQT